MEVFTQAKRIEEIDLETRRKEKLLKQLMEDHTLIAKLCAMLDLEVSEDNV